MIADVVAAILAMLEAETPDIVDILLVMEAGLVPDLERKRISTSTFGFEATLAWFQ